MPLLATLKKDGFAAWAAIGPLLGDLRARESTALAALAAALTAPAADQRELGEGDGAPILVDVARDLRVQKGARLAAVRCALEGGVAGADLGALFMGAGDLVTDPRLGAAAKKLVELGLPAALALPSDALRVSLEAGAFARAVHAAASAVGHDRAKELLQKAPPAHAGASASLFALGVAELPPGDKLAWQKLLAETCAANRRAPAAAKRLGMVPAWPPFLPDAFAPLLKEAEAASAGVESADAAKAGPPPQPKAAAPEPQKQVRMGPSEGPALQRSSSQVVGTRTAAPIRQSNFRRPTGVVVEGPIDGPVRMPAVAPQRSQAQDKAASPAQSVSAPLPGISPPQARAVETERLDPRGRRIPRSDRWSDDAFEWEAPQLPPSTLRPALRARPAQGPFAQRLQSLFEDRPEGVERLCAAAEAREGIAGAEQVSAELQRELALPRWRSRTAPPSQLARLRLAAGDGSQPASWRRAASLVLMHLEAPRET